LKAGVPETQGQEDKERRILKGIESPPTPEEAQEMVQYEES